MLFLYIFLALVVIYFILNVMTLRRITIPLEPPMIPGELTEARDPAYFERQTRTFAESGFEPAGDYLWHHRLTTTAMRVFIARDRSAFGWAYEDAMAGTAEAMRAVSVLSVFADGTVISTTSTRRSTLDPPWLHREIAAAGTDALLRRHRERLAELAAEGRKAVPVRRETLVETIKRIERGLGEYQVRTGRYRLAGGDCLQYSLWGIVWVIGKGLAQIATGPFRRRK